MYMQPVADKEILNIKKEIINALYKEYSFYPENLPNQTYKILLDSQFNDFDVFVALDELLKKEENFGYGDDILENYNIENNGRTTENNLVVLCQVNIPNLLLKVEQIKEVQNTNDDISTKVKSNRPSNCYFIVENGKILYKKKELKLPRKKVPDYYNTFKLIIERFPRNTEEIDTESFFNSLSKEDRKNYEIKNPGVFKDRLSTSGRSFQKMLSKNAADNYNSKTKKVIINASDTTIFFSNEM